MRHADVWWSLLNALCILHESDATWFVSPSIHIPACCRLILINPRCCFTNAVVNVPWFDMVMMSCIIETFFHFADLGTHSLVLYHQWHIYPHACLGYAGCMQCNRKCIRCMLFTSRGASYITMLYQPSTISLLSVDYVDWTLLHPIIVNMVSIIFFPLQYPPLELHNIVLMCWFIPSLCYPYNPLFYSRHYLRWSCYLCHCRSHHLTGYGMLPLLEHLKPPIHHIMH